ncbi:MAG: DUF2207 domain-containing protein [Lachnospiraceae bacterium]|nr:DUF2207 domain-containing protein [Lachnospiraceae bacterium]
MKGKLSAIITWIIIILIVFAPIIAENWYIIEDMQINPFDYARITDVEYKAVVIDEEGGRGKVHVTERLTFDIHAASEDNLFWELWRDLPEETVDGVKNTYKVLSVKQILDNGHEIVYEPSPKLYWEDYDYVFGAGKWYHSPGPYDEENRRYECVFFYVDGLYREEVVFEIEYEMYNATLKYNDCSDVYLGLYSEHTINYLESYKAEILVPDKDMPTEGNYKVFTYGTNEEEFPVKESDTMNPGYHTFYIDLDEDDLQFKPYNEYLEFELVAFNEDKHAFADYAPSNLYTNDDVLDEIYEEHNYYATINEKYSKIKEGLFVALALSSCIVLIYCSRVDKRLKCKYITYKPEYEYKFYNTIPKDLDPNFAAALVFCKHKPPKDDSGVYSAILLSLVRKHYVHISNHGMNDVLITLTKNDTDTFEPLTPSEEYYYNLIARYAGFSGILMSDLQTAVRTDYMNTENFVINMKNSILTIGINDGYFQKANYTEPYKSNKGFATFLQVMGICIAIITSIISYRTRLDLAYGGYFLLGICCFIGGKILKKKSKKFVLLSQYGEDEYAKWRGLYNYLSNESQILNSTIDDLDLWEKYLVYATAFGLSEKITNAISLKCPAIGTEKIGAHSVFDGSYYRSGRYHNHGRCFHSSVRTGSSTAHYSSSYGGGGRGGGGGGGGH